MTKIYPATAWRVLTKRKLIKHKGGKCCRCGYDKDVPGAYDFHHRNPKQKDFGISQYMRLKWELLVKEVRKCDLVCKNCHAEIHDNREQREEILRHQKEREKRLTKVVECIYCKTQFKQTKNKQKYCSHKCYRIQNSYGTKIPAKSELKKLVAKESWVALGRKFGVSDNAVRKWAKKYSLI